MQGVLEFGLSTWASPQCSAAAASYAGYTDAPAAPDDGVNTVEWVERDWSRFALVAEAAAFTDVGYAEVDGVWQIVEADVYLNAESYAWAPGGSADSATQDAATVLTHELGHALGVLHPCEPDAADGAPSCDSDEAFRDSVMYPFYASGQVELAPDDVAAICSLYPREDACDPECEDGSVCTAQGCVEVCGDAPCADGETCVAGACRAPSRCDDVACLSASECAGEPACEAVLGCVESPCERGAAELGDACAVSLDCAASACGVAGYCAPACRDSTDCASGSECDRATHACVAGSPFGASCSGPGDCLGGECLLADDESAVCTRGCGAERASCPSGWSCQSVDAMDVCVPDEDDGCGCSLPGAEGRSSRGWLVTAVLGAIAGTRIRRTRRRTGRG